MKNTTILASLAAVAAVLLFAPGCKKQDVQPTTPDLYQYYEVGFIKNDSMASASARFSTTPYGNAVSFRDRSNVTANGKSDEKPHMESPFFSWTNSSLDFTFNLKKPGNIVITNSVSHSSVDDINLVIDSVLYVADTMHASWTGPAPTSNDDISISLYRDSDSTTGQWSGTSARFIGTSVTLDYAETSKLLPGTYKAYALRKRTLPLQQRDGNAGGEIIVTLIDRKTVVIK